MERVEAIPGKVVAVVVVHASSQALVVMTKTMVIVATASFELRVAPAQTRCPNCAIPAAACRRSRHQLVRVYRYEIRLVTSTTRSHAVLALSLAMLSSVIAVVAAAALVGHVAPFSWPFAVAVAAAAHSSCAPTAAAYSHPRFLFVSALLPCVRPLVLDRFLLRA